MRRVVSDCAIFLIDKAVKMAIMTWLSSECTEIVTTLNGIVHSIFEFQVDHSKITYSFAIDQHWQLTFFVPCTKKCELK